MEVEHLKEIEDLKKDLINLKNDMTFLKKDVSINQNFDSLQNHNESTIHEESKIFLFLI